MTTKDLKSLGDLMDTKLGSLEGRMDIKLNNLEEKMDTKLNQMEEKMDTKLGSLEDKLGNRLTNEIKASEKRIIKGVASFISDHLLPIIDEKADKEEVDKIRRKVNDIELLPTVNHELKVRRKNNS